MIRYTYSSILAIGGMAIAMLSACQSPIREDNSVIHAAPVVRHEENISQLSSAVVQRDINTDMQVYVRSGQPLVLQTEGLSLSALDATVLHEAVYSVTSLMDDELPPLPQGMMNMTEATAGYRLLPGGEHFSPYAELRITYDPERLPKGYTPDDIYTSFYDTSSLAWVRLERVEVVSPMDGLTMIQPPTTTTTSADSSGASIPMPARQRSRMTPQATS